MLRRVDNPPNPYESAHCEWLEPPPQAKVQVYEERARSILSENDSPDVPFRWSCNPYRGCQHGCAYCYARPTHEYLGFGAGTDFDTRLVAKINAPELLAAALARRGWSGEAVHFSGATDCYQPLEAVYRLTRRCLEVCLEHRNPAAVVTKSYLVIRDAELIAELNRVAGANVCVSVPMIDGQTCHALEPPGPVTGSAVRSHPPSDRSRRACRCHRSPHSPGPDRPGGPCHPATSQGGRRHPGVVRAPAAARQRPARVLEAPAKRTAACTPGASSSACVTSAEANSTTPVSAGGCPAPAPTGTASNASSKSGAPACSSKTPPSAHPWANPAPPVQPTRERRVTSNSPFSSDATGHCTVATAMAR